jgi:hypothetical protein
MSLQGSAEAEAHYMWHYMQKPADMKVRTYVHSLMRINHEEICHHLPPFGAADQRLNKDKMIEIILNATPNSSWSQEMDRQNFDPEQQSIHSLLQFCEGIEQLELTSTINHQNGHNRSKKEPKEGHGKCSKGRSDKYIPTRKWCTFHKSDTHNTEDCKVLNAKEGKNKPPYKNITWKKDADESRSYTKKS